MRTYPRDVPGTYRPVDHTVQAAQVCWRNWNELCDFLKFPEGGSIISPDNPGRSVEGFADDCGEKNTNYIEIDIPRQPGRGPMPDVEAQTARHGEWIVKRDGLYRVMSPLEFSQMYDYVQTVDASPR